MNKKEYFAVHSWMVAELGLTGNELMTYAVVYGFTMHSSTHRFDGSIAYIERMTGASRRTVINALQALTDRGLLSKYDRYENGVKYCEYMACKVENHAADDPDESEIAEEDMEPVKPKKKTKKEKQAEDLQEVVQELGTDPALVATMEKWTEYKAEIGKSYTRTGLKSLVKKATALAQVHGFVAVDQIVEDSMASGYQGIVWDRLNRKQTSGRMAASAWMDV